ncbi:doublesex-and mab-3-related transcription factor 2 [Trichonephila clavipes]|nr:doublesex-and mab-3-related transcription factor 2 [Trichonephila clavipes]
MPKEYIIGRRRHYRTEFLNWPQTICHENCVLTYVQHLNELYLDSETRFENALTMVSRGQLKTEKPSKGLRRRKVCHASVKGHNAQVSNPSQSLALLRACDRLRKRRCLADKELDSLLSPLHSFQKRISSTLEALPLPFTLPVQALSIRTQPVDYCVKKQSILPGNTPSFCGEIPEIISKGNMSPKDFANEFEDVSITKNFPSISVYKQKNTENTNKSLSFSVESIIATPNDLYGWSLKEASGTERRTSPVRKCEGVSVDMHSMSESLT